MSSSSLFFDNEPILVSDDEDSISTELTPPSSPIEPFLPPTPASTPPRRTTILVPHSDPDSTEPKFHALRANLSLKGAKCGSPKKDGGSCGTGISRVKLARALDQIDEIVYLSPASTEFQDDLMDVARTLHCRHHNRQKCLDLRVQEWMDICLPTNRDENPAETLRTEIKKALSFSRPICMVCPNAVGGQKVENCRQTIDEVCELVIDPDSSRDIAYLLRVLRFNRLCPKHDKIKVKETTEWHSVIMALFHKHHDQEPRLAKSLPHDDDKDHTHADGGTLTPQTPNSLDNSEASSSPPPPPAPALSTSSGELLLEASFRSRLQEIDLAVLADYISVWTMEDEEALPVLTHTRTALGTQITIRPNDDTVPNVANVPNYDLKTYWPAMSDESPLQASDYNPNIENKWDARRKAWDLARTFLTGRVRQSGYIYAYQVDGNPDYVKIGWTGYPVHRRLKEWQFDCNRKTTQVYPRRGFYAVSVENARRVEGLCHAELAHVRVKVECRACLAQHQEWFKVTPKVAIKTIQKWSRWMETEPYERVMKGDEEIWRLKGGEMKRVLDLT